MSLIIMEVEEVDRDQANSQTNTQKGYHGSGRRSTVTKKKSQTNTRKGNKEFEISVLRTMLERVGLRIQ